MKRPALQAVLVACLLVPLLVAGGCAAPPAGDLAGSRDGGSPAAGETPLSLFPDVSFPARTLAAQDWYERGFALTNDERYSEAVNAYEHALDANRSLLNAWYYLGDALFRLGRPREALLAFGNATAIDPDFVDAYFYESRIYGKLGLDEEEENALREGLDAADRRKTNQSAPSIPSVPRPVPQGLPAAIPLIAVGIALACMAFRRRIRRS
jgi:tetratricopeptide (TPR) repeat protein